MNKQDKVQDLETKLRRLPGGSALEHNVRQMFRLKYPAVELKIIDLQETSGGARDWKGYAKVTYSTETGEIGMPRSVSPDGSFSKVILSYSSQEGYTLLPELQGSVARLARDGSTQRRDEFGSAPGDNVLGESVMKYNKMLIGRRR
ncbi:hypothetical protein KY363_04860 [Candidatus Woesearchaeota archaeon]|nr:hypothetical protein [Candidatus Woesearchaeota archaeon]